MRSSIAASLLVAALGGGIAAGCGGNVTETSAGGQTSSGGGGTTGAGASGGTTSAGGGGASTSTTTTGGGGAGDPDGTIDGATPIEFGSQTDDALDPTGDIDFFTFQGTKGQPLYISAYAEGLDDVQFDPDHVDTVVTLFNDKGEQIAENNDQIPTYSADARLLTMLPEDGTYYLRVAECWTVVKNPAANCGGTKDKGYTAYRLYFRELDPVNDGNSVADKETGDDAASAVEMQYLKNGNTGYYYFTFVYGTFRDQSDVDVFSFELPPDVPMNGRPAGSFYFYPSDKTGDGSTAPIGSVWITSAADPTTIIARVDGKKNAGISPPLPTGTPYLAFIQHPSSAAGAFDFYFMEHYAGPVDVAETDDIGNDSIAGAEPVAPVAQANGVTAYFPEGDIVSAGTDVDHFSAAIPAGLGSGATLRAGCNAQRRGSGLRGVKAALLKTDGTVLASDTETETHFASVSGIPIPPGANNVVLQVSATSQDPEVTSTFYRCWVYVNP